MSLWAFGRKLRLLESQPSFLYWRKGRENYSIKIRNINSVIVGEQIFECIMRFKSWIQPTFFVRFLVCCFLQLKTYVDTTLNILQLYSRKRAFEMTANFNQSDETGSWKNESMITTILLYAARNECQKQDVLRFITSIWTWRKSGCHAGCRIRLWWIARPHQYYQIRSELSRHIPSLSVCHLNESRCHLLP